ncbi:MAG TPA: MJ1477/TM1410 family putative glycoside hydrolase [Verrucomicrobiae bacterium]|nr:MJ1477/TM1410 family putative glycoside hydrolase [Verrucomicrobiae bacterium]
MIRNSCCVCVALALALAITSAHAQTWQPGSFLYQLQNLNISNAAASPFPVIVTDYSHDGSAAGELTSNEVVTLKAGGAKTVLAYLSIGEAESYRVYWNPSWVAQGKSTTNRLAWLGPANPQFPNNYKVRYWDPAWQSIIYGSSTGYLDRILAQGFDGAYLDVIDAYEFWGPDGNLPISQQNSNAVADMVNFVLSLTAYARGQPGHANFLIVPQNGAALVTNADYLAGISALGAEDTWFNGDHRQQTSDTAYVVPLLDMVVNSGKPVLAIDYPQKATSIDAFYGRAEARGYVPYASDRGLDQLVVHPGHDPAVNLSVTLTQPADRTDVRPASATNFVWQALGGSGALRFQLTFSGDDAFTTTRTIPAKSWLTTTNYTPTTAEWSAILKLAGNNSAGRIWWWVTVQDANGQLRSSHAQRLYRLHTKVSTTEFWVGEPADSDNGHISNTSSAWDDLWEQHFGGVDDPNHRSTDPSHPYWPAFTPNENPFYFALPYDDFTNQGNRRPNFQQVVPWAMFTDFGTLQSAVKNHWIKIVSGGKTCYAQWEDVGPFSQNDVKYVFGIARPSSSINQHAGLDTSPAVQQYLGLTGLDPTDWRFVYPDETVPAGPWTEIITTNQITWLP